jgi:hypothetical protein
MTDEKQLDRLSRFHREREEWQREQQKFISLRNELRQKAEAEWLDGSRGRGIQGPGQTEPEFLK